MKYLPETLSISQLLLDPNNYRFFDMEGYVRADHSRFHEQSVQRKAEELIKLDGRDELRALKESIEVNGYTPIEVIIVKPYIHKDGLYVIVEGNRRVTAMNWIIEDRNSGSSISQELVDSFDQLPVIILDPEDSEYANQQHVLMGLRHVSGIKQWGGYQRAKLIVELVDELGLSITDGAKQIGMSSHEALRRYRAFKALEQMQSDEEFGEYAKPSMYRLFHEAVSVTKIKDWLEWDNDTYRFTNDDSLHTFYSLLIPYMPEDEEEIGRAREPKLNTYQDVRSLREILGNVEAEETLLDSDQSLSDALAVAKASAGPNWLPRVRAATQAINKLPATTLKRLSESEIKPMIDLYIIDPINRTTC